MNSKLRTGPALIHATRPYAYDSTSRSWWHVISTALLLLAALAGTHWNLNLAGRASCSVLTALLLLRFFVIYHDQQHHAILPRSRLAAGLMRIFGILALSPSSIWRSSHNHHHNHNSKLRGSHIGSFPIMTKDQFLKSSPAIRQRYLFMRHPLTILFGYLFVFLFGMCLVPFCEEPRKHADGLIALLVHAALGTLLVLQWGWAGLLLTQTLPCFIFFAFGTYLFYAQHNFPSVAFADRAGWTHSKAAAESSSYMVTGRLMAWFTANIGYHQIHHLNARIPFYRLPQVFRELPELRSPKVTSLHPAEILRCLRLKVWDVKAQRMVGLRELDLPAAAAVG